MSFSERLKERRIALDFTQAQLADKLGVTKSAICNYETGVSSPRIDILYKMFDVLDCDANMLFRDEIGEAENAERYAPPNVRELEMITKYRTLDAHGKRVVDLVLDEEAARVEADTAPPKMYHIKIAGFDGSFVEKDITEEEADAIRNLPEYDGDI